MTKWLALLRGLSKKKDSKNEEKPLKSPLRSLLIGVG